MAEPFVSEIMMFSGNFSPRGWAFCSGQILPVHGYTTLYALIGTTYGGGSSGRIQTMGLPDLRGRTPIGEGQLPGGSNYSLGESGGAEYVNLTPNNLPAHNHGVSVSTSDGPPNSKDPNNNVLSDNQAGAFFSSVGGATPKFKASESGETGGNMQHNNMQPFLTVNYCIALSGIFPSRS